MDRTLLLASVDQVTVLTKKHVRNAISTMKDIKTARRNSSTTKVGLAISAALLVVVLLVSLFFHSPFSGTVAEIAASSIFKQLQVWTRENDQTAGMVCRKDSRQKQLAIPPDERR